MLGHVGEHEVRSPFAGVLQSYIAVDTERVTARQPIAWLRTDGPTPTEEDEMPATRPAPGSGHHRVGHGAARQGRHQRRPQPTRAWTRATSGSSSAPASASATSAGPRPGCRPRPAGRSAMAGARPGIDRRPGAGHHHPDRTARPRRPRCRTSSACVRRVRHQRRLLGVRVRPGRRPRPDRHGRRTGPRDRHRHARPHHRLGGPQHRRPLRRRLRRGGARGGRRRRPAARLGPRRRRQAERSCTPRSAATSRWTARRCSAGRADHGRLGRPSRWSTPA